jgi:hypothetical protein
MQLSSSTTSRTLFLLLSLLCCARAAGPRPLNSPPRRVSRRKRSDDLVSGQPQSAVAATTGDFTLQLAPASFMISIVNTGSGPVGQAIGTATLTGVNGFAGEVELDCNISGQVSVDEPTCDFSQFQVPVDASGAASMAVVTANSQPPGCYAPDDNDSSVGNFNGDSGRFAEAAIGLLLLALLIRYAGRMPPAQRATAIRAAFICAFGFAMAGCVGQSAAAAHGCGAEAFDPGTPAGTYMLTVTATSGNISHSMTVPLTVPASQ